jgi:hypothetical protein
VWCSVGAGCSQLLSDMQAFKVTIKYIKYYCTWRLTNYLTSFLWNHLIESCLFDKVDDTCEICTLMACVYLSKVVWLLIQAANPGCILEDFVRWYSPLDWREEPGSGLMFQGSAENAGKDGAVRGYLSARMQCQGGCISVLNHLRNF